MKVLLRFGLNYWRAILSFTLSFTLVWNSYALAAGGKENKAKAPPQVQPLKEIRPDMETINDFLKTTGLTKKELTLKELYEKMAPNLPEFHRKSFQVLANQFPKMKIPKMTVSKVKNANGQEEAQLIFNYQKKSYVMNFPMGSDTFMRMGDMKITHADMKNFDKKATPKLSKHFFGSEKAVSREVASVKAKKWGTLKLLSAKDVKKLSKKDRLNYYEYLKQFYATIERLQHEKFGLVSFHQKSQHPYPYFAALFGQYANAASQDELDDSNIQRTYEAPNGACIVAGHKGAWTQGVGPVCSSSSASNGACGSGYLTCNEAIFGTDASGSAYCVPTNDKKVRDSATSRCGSQSAGNCPKTDKDYASMKAETEKLWADVGSSVCNDGDFNMSFRSATPWQASACQALLDWKYKVDTRTICSKDPAPIDDGGGVVVPPGSPVAPGPGDGGVDNGGGGPGGDVGTGGGRVPASECDKHPPVVVPPKPPLNPIAQCNPPASELDKDDLKCKNGKVREITCEQTEGTTTTRTIRYWCDCKDNYSSVDGKCVKDEGTKGDGGSDSGGGFFGAIGGFFSKIWSGITSFVSGPYFPYFLAGAVSIGVGWWAYRHYLKDQYKYITPDEAEPPVEAPTIPEDPPLGTI